MTNREHVTTLDTKDFAQWVFERTLHWNGYDDFVVWLDEERVNV